MTLLIYSQVSHFQFINFDDGGYVFKNPKVQASLSLMSILWAFTTTQLANWHPLTWLSHIADFQLYGLNAGGHHLTSLFFHLANTTLLFFVFAKMTNAIWQSAVVAVLFALHPLHVESVVWIAERKDVLSAFFWILTLRAYIYYVERPAIYRYLLVFFAFLSGLMAKPMVVTLPFVLFLIDYWPLNRFPRWGLLNRRSQQTWDSKRSDNNGVNFSYLLLEKIPLLLLSAASSVMTFYAQRNGGAVNQLIPLTTRISNAAVSYMIYLGKMLWPQNLCVFYPYQVELSMWQTIGSGILLGVISFWSFKKAKQYPYLAVGWFWFVGTLVPVIGLVQVGAQAMADRYTYIPLIGVFIMMAWGIPDLLSRLSGRRIFLGFIAGIVLSILSILSWVQVTYWKNSVTLFQHAVNVSAGNFKAHDLLGFTLMEQGKLDEAIFHFREAIRFKPKYGSAYNNLGVALEKKGKVNQAMAQYLEALRVLPDFSEAHYNLGIIMFHQRNFEMADYHFRSALRINKKYAEAYNNLGVVLLAVGKIEEAINHISEALKINPAYADAHYNLANALVCESKIDEALIHFQEALRIQPDFEKALNNLRMLQAHRDRTNEVVASFQKVLILNPDSFEIHKGLQELP